MGSSSSSSSSCLSCSSSSSIIVYGIGQVCFFSYFHESLKQKTKNFRVKFSLSFIHSFIYLFSVALVKFYPKRNNKKKKTCPKTKSNYHFIRQWKTKNWLKRQTHGLYGQQAKINNTDQMQNKESQEATRKKRRRR